MSIRFTSKGDCAAIAEIYNHVVLHTAVIWNDQTVNAENRVPWYEARQLMGYPVPMSEESGVVTGYTSFGDWCSSDDSCRIVERSIYAHPEHQRKGLGRTLLGRLINEARVRGRHMMVIGIESQNRASLHLHGLLGSKAITQMPRVGTKLGRWLDLTFIQLQLDDRRDPNARK